MVDPATARADLRDAVQRMRRPLDKQVLRAASSRAVELLAGLQGLHRARVVALHEPAPGDLDPQGVTSALADRGIRVLLVDPRADDVRVMAAGRARLVGGEDPAGDLDLLDAVLVPGVAFDLDGGRLGHGPGRWEDLLERLDPDVLRIGLAHTTQLVPRVPRRDDDRMLDVVVTDRGVHHTGARVRPRDA